jgi:hypothetical protein
VPLVYFFFEELQANRSGTLKLTKNNAPQLPLNGYGSSEDCLNHDFFEDELTP